MKLKVVVDETAYTDMGEDMQTKSGEVVCGWRWRFTGCRYVHFIFRIHGVSLTMSWKIFPAIGAVREVVEDAGGLASDILLSPFGLITIYTGG